MAVTLLATAGQAATQAAASAAPATFTGAQAAPAAPAPGPTGNPFDEVDRLANPKDNTPAPAPAPGAQHNTSPRPRAAPAAPPFLCPWLHEHQDVAAHPRR
ncbi:hypothetical protein [Streptomyces sp. NPDC059538]|uniref:hypothetical protein n=1 Tax=Streptomyces sp. NPDC059538 TaxID=3346860 RepID=UPI0036C8A3D9